MKLGRWSTAAGSNNSATPDGWPEGQLPSTVNDCAREMMASIRTAAMDFQFIDQDYTPTYITSSSFSVPGNQTSAIQIGRRLKLFDATAGVQQILYATVASVSFTSVTTVQLVTDSGSLTASLSSFGISIISNTSNGLPRDSDMTVSSIAVGGNMSISGAAVLLGPVSCAQTLSVSGAAACGSTLSVSATATASVFVSGNTPKAYVSFAGTTPPTVGTTYNVASVSRSAQGVYRITFGTAFADNGWIINATVFWDTPFNGNVFGGMSAAAGSCKLHVSSAGGTFQDAALIHATFYHP